MNPKVSKMLDKIHPDIRSMSKDEGCSFIIWLSYHNITIRNFITYTFDYQFDLLQKFRNNHITKE